MENYLPTYKTRLDELADDEKELYNTLFGGSFESDRQAAIERAAFYERMSSAAKAPAEVAEPEGERGFFNNAMRGAGERAADLGGGLLNSMAAAVESAPQGGFAPGYVGQFVSPEQDAKNKDLAAASMAGGANTLRATDLGYDEKRNTLDGAKAKFGVGQYLGAAAELFAAGNESMLTSAPDMVGAVAALPVYVAARTGEIANERAKNKGLERPTQIEINEAAPFALASSLLERILPGRVLRGTGEISEQAAKEISDGAIRYVMQKSASEAGTSALIEGGTEFVQEGVIEYIGQRFGTDAAMDASEALSQGVEAAILGGVGGGTLGAAKGAYDGVSAARSAPSQTEDDGIDQPTNGEQLGGGGVDDMPQSMPSAEPVEVDRPLLREAGNPNDPNDRYKFELDTDSFVAKTRAAPAFPADVNVSLNPTAGLAERIANMKARRQARAIDDSVSLPPIEFESAPLPEQQQSQALSLAPMEAPALAENTVEFVRPEIPVRTNQLASGVERAISQNIDKARNSRMPENLKDVRLLRSRYRTHLNDVANGIESNAGAFEKADSLLEMAAKNGGLNADAWVSEGVDPADLKTNNGSAFTKAFRADGGMTPDDLAEFAAQNGFAGFTDDSGAPVSGAAVEAILGELSGSKRYSSADESKLQSAQAAPAYIKELAEFGSPAEIKKAVTKALNGEKLGARQAIIVQEVLDSTNRFKRDDSAVIEKWEKRARTMLSNKGNRELDQWRNRDEHAADATTEEAALNELMTDAMVQHGIDPDKVIAAHEQYAKRYPDSLGKLTYAMTAWVSANKPANSEPEQNGKRDNVPGYRSNRRDDERVQIPIQRSAGESGAAEAGLSVSRQRQAAETAAAPERIESGAPAESGSDSAGRDAGLRQPVDLPEGWDKSLIKARRIAKSLDVPAYNTMRLGALAEAIRAKQSPQPEVDEAEAAPPDEQKPAKTESIPPISESKQAESESKAPIREQADDEPAVLFKKDSNKSETASITRDDAQAIIDRISKDWKVPVKIKLIDSIADLPNSIKSRMSKDDGGAEPAALIDESTGHVYINLSKVESERSIEELVFHEVYTHFGLRQLMGNEAGPIMGRLYLSLGAAEVDRLAKKYGVNVEAYEKAYEGRPAEMRRAIIAEELLAHMSEHAKPSVVKFAQELVGAIRSWLRKNGFAELAKISESDMRYLLKQARETVTKGKNGDFTGLIYSLAGIGKADRRAMNKARAEALLPEATQELVEDDDLLTAWAYISQREESFQLPTSRKKDLVEIAQDIEGMNGFVITEADELALQNDYGAENAWRIKTPGGDKAAVFQKADKVWIDVSDLESGDAGKRIYNIVANYAINTDRVFQGDPAGLSIMAKSRRLENMLSSAMKFGTTRHLQPHKLQLKDDAGVPALKWKKGDDVNNIREMIITSYEAVKNQFPEIENLRYDPESDSFVDALSGEEITDARFNDIAANARREFDSLRDENGRAGGRDSQDSDRSPEGAGRGQLDASSVRESSASSSRVRDSGRERTSPSAGSATLKRAVLTNTILRGTRSQRSKLLEQLSGQRSERLDKILYALPKTRLTGGFSFGGSKTPRGATLPHQLKDAYNQLGGANKTLFEKVKTEVRRQLAPRGLLPSEIFDLKIARDGAMNSDDSQQRFILTDFYAQVQKVYEKPYHELRRGTRKEINDYLKGDRTNVQLTDSMIDVLARMRTQIQSLSKSYMDQLLLDAANLEADGKLEAAAAKRALIETITDNFDNYLHRSYRAFDDPDWPKKVPEDVYQNAVNFLAREYSGSATPDAAAIEKATKKVDLILHEGTAYDSMGRFISESKLGSKDLSVIKKRKQISPEIRALLGEYEDPAINYAKSVTKMTRLVHNTSFLRQMTDISLQLGYIFEEENRPVGANKKIAADASEVYAPLNGMYTYPEFEQALRDAVGSNKEPDWYKVMVAANGAVKYGKTVLAPTTAVRNFLSASMFSLTSGHWDVRHLEKSIRSAKTYLTGKDVRGSREYINHLLKLGVLYDSPNYRELQDLIKSVNESEHWLAKATRKSKMGAALNYAQEFYAMGDDFWKILGFENEKAMLIKHYKMSEAAAEKEAAERIRNTYPTYSLTGKGIQTLRRFPVIGSFPSFPAEIIRTTFHKFRYFHKDAKALGYTNPSVLAKGVGLALGAGLMSGLSALSAAVLGVDDDEEEAIRQMLPEWSRNSSLFFLGRDDKGQVQYMDLGWLDPYGYWKKPIAALARDADTTDKLGDAAWEALSPFLGLDIAVGTTGQFVYDSFFNDSITTEKAAEKLTKGLSPGFVNNIMGFWEASNETVTKSGKRYTYEDEALALIGFRKGTLNTKVGLTYQAYGYADKKRQAATVLREKATDLGKVDIDELRSAYEKSMGMQRDAWDDMRRTVKMAMKTGMNQSEAVGALRTSGISLRDARAIASGSEFVYRPSKSMMKRAIKQAGILFDQETQAELVDRQKRLNELQRQYMEKPVR